jgi:hypothetical protein
LQSMVWKESGEEWGEKKQGLNPEGEKRKERSGRQPLFNFRTEIHIVKEFSSPDLTPIF